MGLKPLWVGEQSAKSNSTRSDLIEPFFNALVPGWSPSSVRKRMAMLVFRQFVDVNQARLLQRLAHIVHIEPEHAGGELLALAVLVGMALLAPGDDLGGVLAADDHNAVIVSDHGISRHHIDAGADHRDVHRSEERRVGKECR